MSDQDTRSAAPRYDDKGRCLDCDGLGGCHALDCPPMSARSRRLARGEWVPVTDSDSDAPDGATIYDDERDQWLTRCGLEWRIATEEEIERA